MKKIINRYKVLLFAFLAVFAMSCSGDDTSEVFEDTPTARVNERIDELRTLLKSSDTGWKAVYFTDNTQLGGFTFFFNFIDDDNVVMSSDFDDDTSLVTSKYDVVLGSTVKLSFTTKNDIHKLSDSANPPDSGLVGRGYLGDFEFLYYGVDDVTGDIIFRTNRTQEELRFTKVAVIADELNDLDDSILIAAGLSDPTKSVYQNMVATIGGVTEVFNFSFNVNRRYVTAFNDNNSYSFGVAYTANGLTINPSITIAGQEITEFVYNPATDEFAADLGGGDTVVISYLDAPGFPTNDNLLVVDAENSYGYIDQFLFDAQTSSPNFQEVINATNTDLGAIGFRLLRATINFNETGDPALNSIQYRVERLSDGATGNFDHFVTYENIDGKLILSDDGWDGSGIDPFLQAIDRVLTNPEGLYVKREDFRVRFNNAIFTFTSVEDTSIRMTTYAFQ